MLVIVTGLLWSCGGCGDGNGSEGNEVVEVEVAADDEMRLWIIDGCCWDDMSNCCC